MAHDRTIRIGCASAFWGDSQTAAAQLVDQGDLDYLVFDYLAEVTMSILAGQRMKDAGAGYARDFVDTAMTPLLGEIAGQKLTVIANAGGVNPLACRDALAAACDQAGVRLRIAVVLGDDLSRRQDELRQLGLRETHTGRELPPFLVSANAYLGAQPVAAALAEDADVIITGRVIDASEALAIGLANEVVPSGTCVDRALELARFICELPQPVIRTDKEAAVRGLGQRLDDGLLIEARAFNRSILHPATQEGLRRFNERDHPDRQGHGSTKTPGLVRD